MPRMLVLSMAFPMIKIGILDVLKFGFLCEIRLNSD